MFKGFGSLGVQRHVGASERYYNGHLLSDGTHCQIPLVPDELSEKILVRSSRVRPIRSQLQTCHPFVLLILSLLLKSGNCFRIFELFQYQSNSEARS